MNNHALYQYMPYIWYGVYAVIAIGLIAFLWWQGKKILGAIKNVFKATYNAMINVPNITTLKVVGFWITIIALIVCVLINTMIETPAYTAISSSWYSLFALVGISIVVKVLSPLASIYATRREYSAVTEGYVTKINVSVVAFVTVLALYDITASTIGQEVNTTSQNFKAENNAKIIKINDSTLPVLQQQAQILTDKERITVNKDAKEVNEALRDARQDLTKAYSNAVMSTAQAFQKFTDRFSLDVVDFTFWFALVRSILLTASGIALAILATIWYRDIAPAAIPLQQSGPVRNTPQTKTDGGSSQSSQPDQSSPPTRPDRKSVKKKQSSTTSSKRTDKQIVISLEEWKQKNPGQTVNRVTELKDILGIGYDRVQRMKRDGIDLMAIANGTEKRGFLAIAKGA